MSPWPRPSPWRPGSTPATPRGRTVSSRAILGTRSTWTTPSRMGCSPARSSPAAIARPSPGDRWPTFSPPPCRRASSRPSTSSTLCRMSTPPPPTARTSSSSTGQASWWAMTPMAPSPPTSPSAAARQPPSSPGWPSPPSGSIPAPSSLCALPVRRRRSKRWAAWSLTEPTGWASRRGSPPTSLPPPPWLTP